MVGEQGYLSELLITMPDGSLQSQVIKNPLLLSLPTSLTQVSIRKIERRTEPDGREKREEPGRS